MDSKTLAEKIAAGMTAGSAVDQTHAKNAKHFKEGEHMDESYLENDDENHLIDPDEK